MSGEKAEMFDQRLCGVKSKFKLFWVAQEPGYIATANAQNPDFSV